MKKLYLAIAMAVSTMAVSAQQVLNLSTFNGSDLQKYDGQECKVNVNRYVFAGWNTIALPFDMTEGELCETFGADCRLERLVGAEEMAGQVTLLFQDCRHEGIQANVPYIIYYNGENGNKRVSKLALVTSAEAAVSFPVKGSQEVVTMAAAQRHFDGVGCYGVLAADNADARFVAVNGDMNGFYATRCFVRLASGNTKALATQHLGAGEVSAISDVLRSQARVDVYNLSGAKVAQGLDAAQVARLQPGIYVINGQKVAVK